MGGMDSPVHKDHREQLGLQVLRALMGETEYKDRRGKRDRGGPGDHRDHKVYRVLVESRTPDGVGQHVLK